MEMMFGGNCSSHILVLETIFYSSRVLIVLAVVQRGRCSWARLSIVGVTGNSTLKGFLFSRGSHKVTINNRCTPCWCNCAIGGQGTTASAALDSASNSCCYWRRRARSAPPSLPYLPCLPLPSLRHMTLLDTLKIAQVLCFA